MRTVYSLVIGLLLCSLSQAAVKNTNGTGGGDWDAVGTWAGGVVPVDTDQVNILVGDTVIFNVDQSGFANGIDLDIDGILTADSAAGVYYLMCSADVTGSGTWNIGSSGTAYPLTCTFTIDFNGAGNSVQSSSLTLAWYPTQPTNKYAKLTGVEAIGQTVLSIDTDLTSDTWAVGDRVRVDDISTGNPPDTEYAEIDAIAATTITLKDFGGVGAATLAAQKEIGALVVLVTRNIVVTGSTTYHLYSINDSVFGGLIECTVAGAGMRACRNNTIDGLVVNACSTYADYDSWGDTFDDSVFTGGGAGSVGSLSSRRNTFNDCVISGTRYCGQTTWTNVYNSTIFNGSQFAFYLSHMNIFNSCEFQGTTSALHSTDGCIVNTCTFDLVVTECIESSYGTRFYNCSFDGVTTEFSGYNDSDVPEYLYTESTEHDQTTNALKAWMHGGIVTSQTASPPSGYTIWYEHACEDTAQTYSCFRQYETVVLPGTAIEVQGQIRIADGEDLTGYAPTLEIIDTYADPLVDSTQSALDSDPIPDPDGSDSSWQDVDVIWANTGDSSRTVIVRMRAEHDGGGDDVDIDSVWSIATYKDQIDEILKRVKRISAGSEF